MIKPEYEFSGSFNLNYFDICSLLLALEERDIFKQNLLQSLLRKTVFVNFLSVSISDVRSLVT